MYPIRIQISAKANRKLRIEMGSIESNSCDLTKLAVLSQFSAAPSD